MEAWPSSLSFMAGLKLSISSSTVTSAFTGGMVCPSSQNSSHILGVICGVLSLGPEDIHPRNLEDLSASVVCWL